MTFAQVYFRTLDANVGRAGRVFVVVAKVTIFGSDLSERGTT